MYYKLDLSSLGSSFFILEPTIKRTGGDEVSTELNFII